MTDYVECQDEFEKKIKGLEVNVQDKFNRRK